MLVNCTEHNSVFMTRYSICGFCAGQFALVFYSSIQNPIKRRWILNEFFVLENNWLPSIKL